ncbi:MAG: HDOD domain-containing protein [Spartobacteria bacterium]|nr:HDOD domain-containing protein [Spartobacteria bacterium]
MSADYIRRDILEKIRSIPVLQPVCEKIVTCLSNPDIGFDKVSELMRYDPAMTANILKMANSAGFGASREIQSLQAAFVRIGAKRLLQLVVAHQMVPMVNEALPGYGLEKQEFLRHCVWVALASEDLAYVLKVKNAELLFTAGLLHDLGKTVTGTYVQEHRAHIIEEAEKRHVAFDLAEMHVLGINHPEAGAVMLENWSFPREIITCVRRHHEPAMAEEFRSSVDVVHVADILAYSQGIGAGLDAFQYHVDEAVLDRLKVRTLILEQVAARTVEKMEMLQKSLDLL